MVDSFQGNPQYRIIVRRLQKGSITTQDSNIPKKEKFIDIFIKESIFRHPYSFSFDLSLLKFIRNRLIITSTTSFWQHGINLSTKGKL